MKEKLIIIGSSTTAKQVYDFVEEYDLYDVVAFSVNAEYKKNDTFCGKPIYELECLENLVNKSEVKVFIAILWNRLNAERRMLYEQLEQQGFQFANIISPFAKVRGKILGGNCWIHDFTIIQSDVELGRDCMVMANVLIGAFSKIGAHCFLGTKSTVAGCCEIGEQTFVGINCTVFDNTKIGKKCILGACTNVKRNIENYSIVKTTRDNIITIQSDEMEIESKLMFSKNVR